MGFNSAQRKFLESLNKEHIACQAAANGKSLESFWRTVEVKWASHFGEGIAPDDHAEWTKVSCREHLRTFRTFTH